MLVVNVLRRRVYAGLGVGCATAVVLLGLSSVAVAQQAPPTSGWPILEVANPGPGALVPSGDIIISGSAFDPAATTGAGVSHVDLFLGDRDQGGIFLGSAIPGQDAMSGLTPGGTALESFQVSVTMPNTITGGRDFVAYAYSSVTGRVTSVSMPIFIAVAPTPMATPAAPQVAEIEHLGASQGTGGEMLSLGNPSAGDVVLYGDYVVSGATGSAIDRVQLFLDDRDTGGTALGTVTPANGTFTATVKIPTSVNGSHTFTAYAYSSATGQESKVSVQVYIGTPPTPTPRPAS